MKGGCEENKQSGTTSSSISDGSYAFTKMSPVASSPAVSSSPSHRRTSGPIRRAKGGWTPHEDETLRHAVKAYKGRCWKKIAEFFPDRTEVQCLHRWQKVINPELVKGPWSTEEDEKIIALVAKYGPRKWSLIAKSLPGRIGKQCRERTDNSIKNHWNSSLKKKLDFHLATGQLPATPKPCVHNGPKDVANQANVRLFPRSDKGSDRGSKTSCQTTEPDTKTKTVCEDANLPIESCKYDARKSDLEPQAFKYSDFEAFTGRPAGGPDISDAIDCTTRAIQIDPISKNDSCLEVQMGECRKASEVDQTNMESGTSLAEVSSTLGPLFYEPPLLIDHLSLSTTSPLATSYQYMQQAYNLSNITSPRGYLTPLFSNGRSSGEQSVESILRTAAESFSNTPSIIRRRKREVDSSLAAEKTVETTRTKISDVSCTPDEGRTPCEDEVRLSNGNGCNDSPAYLSRRTARFKSIEKKLDFNFIRREH